MATETDPRDRALCFLPAALGMAGLLAWPFLGLVPALLAALALAVAWPVAAVVADVVTIRRRILASQERWAAAADAVEAVRRAREAREQGGQS